MSFFNREVWVFGSNTQGRHGKGAAKEALKKHGAIYGQAEGLQGNSYGIITKELRPNKKRITLKQIRASVKKFIKFAKRNPQLRFNVAPIGCGLAGRTPKQIGPMFFGSPKNVNLPREFRKYCRSLEDRFELAFRKKFPELPQPKKQVKFCKDRKWPFDFAWPKYKLAVEIQGGSFIFGGHNRGKSQANDFHKNNAAVKLGWRVLFFNTEMIGKVDSGKIYDCVEFTAEVLCNAREV